MSSEFEMGQSQGQKLVFAFRRNGEGNSLLDWLSTGDNLGLVGRLQRGEVDLVIKCKSAQKPGSRIIKLGDALNPETFISPGLKVVTDETDLRSEVFTELDLDSVRFATAINDRETTISGYERLERLKASGKIRLGGKAFVACWENRHMLPESWKEDGLGNTRYIFFDGVVLRDSGGYWYTPFMYFEKGSWFRHFRAIKDYFSVRSLSAVIAG